MNVELAPDVLFLVKKVLQTVPLTYIDHSRIICIRSFGAKSRAQARIWSFPKIWQLALSLGPHYVIEVLSHHFDKLSYDDKIRVVIHELMHIPKNFSGSLIPHKTKHKHIDRRSVEKLFVLYKNSSSS